MINAYLTDTVEIITTTRDEWQNPLYETIESVPARIVYKTRRLLTAAGEDVVSERTIMIQHRTLDHGAIIKIDGIRWAILLIQKPKDFTWQFIEVILGGRL
jgi:hypothetical protein